jgi:hypothetical protein
MHLYNPDFDEESLEIIHCNGRRAQVVKTMMLGTAAAKANPSVYILGHQFMFGVHDCCHAMPGFPSFDILSGISICDRGDDL